LHSYRESIQYQASILASNLESITSHLQKHSDLLSRTVAYPSTNFPGRTQENLLTLLLRKKAEPAVESWIEEGRALGTDEESHALKDDAEDLWTFASESVGQMVAKTVLRTMNDGYTSEERATGVESVNTGLAGGLDPDLFEDSEEEDEDEEDDDEDEEMGGVDGESRGRNKARDEEDVARQPVAGAKSLEDIVRFMTTGKGPGERA
jgi:mediator of RNA polymerase II transcription subunit 8